MLIRLVFTISHGFLFLKNRVVRTYYQALVIGVSVLLPNASTALEKPLTEIPNTRLSGPIALDNEHALSANSGTEYLVTSFLLLMITIPTIISLYMSVRHYKHKYYTNQKALIQVNTHLSEQSKSLRELLDSSENQLTQLKKERASFFCDLGNELRNPLTVLKTILDNQSNASFQKANTVSEICLTSSLSSLERVSQRSLLISELMQNQQLTWCDASSLAMQVSEHFYNQFPHSSCQLHTKIEANCEVFANEKALSALLETLIADAYMASPDESEIYIFMKFEDDRLMLTVADQGSHHSSHDDAFGFSQLLKRQLFKACSATATSIVKPDIGKRLSIFFTKARKSQMGKCELGSFTCQTAHVTRIHKPLFEYESSTPNAPRCVLVENNPEVQLSFSELLSEHFHVAATSDYDTALAQITETPPRIIVMDISVQGKMGFEFIKSIRQNPDFLDVPIMVVTANSLAHVQLKAIELGAQLFLSKPITSEFLKNAALTLYRRISPSLSATNNASELAFTQSKDAIFLAQLNSLIQENLSNKDFHFEDFFEDFALSKRQFFRRVNTLTRCTPKQYLIERRLELAKYLLTNGLQITEVVERTGFKNINSFKKLYAVHFGHEII